MAKDDSLFMLLYKVLERKICVVDEFSLDIVDYNDVPYKHGRIFDIYHVLNLNAIFCQFPN
jgi:hypothetical protein